MKISREWLQCFFSEPLPSADALSDALTFHAFEIESLDGGVLDVKVTPNRGHDCLSHRGIAKEISAILNFPLKVEYHWFTNPLILEPITDKVTVSIDTSFCDRYIAGVICGVKVGPSPEWLKKLLESVGQKSINNIVDAANYVMFSIGQPLHAFDAGKLLVKGGKYSIRVKSARAGEKITTLDDKEYSLSEAMIIISDQNADVSIGIAGVKGGKLAEVTNTTTDMIIESANFDAVSVRKTAQALRLRTDASIRFEQAISPEIAVYGMRGAADLIIKLAGGELLGFVDQYPKKQKDREISISVQQVNDTLGTTLSDDEIANTFTRLGLQFEANAGVFVVSPPFERLDLMIRQDLSEEVGRIVGYEKIHETELPPISRIPKVNKNFYTAENVRENLMSQGYSEVYTSVFSDKGEREVLNKAGSEWPFLRDGLGVGLGRALKKNIQNKDILGIKEVKLFEIGTVWTTGKEEIFVCLAGENEEPTQIPLDKYVKELPEPEDYQNLPISSLQRYKPFSRFPFIIRDIALWIPSIIKADHVEKLIKEQAGELLVRIDLFDRFEKNGKISLAFRLVFQSFVKTLADKDAHERMEKIYEEVKKQGWEVR